MEAAWFRASQWELTRRGWGNAQRWEDNRSVWGICEAPACPFTSLQRGEKPRPTKAQKGKMCKGAYIHLFKCHRTKKGLNKSPDQPSIYPPKQGSFESNVLLSPTPYPSSLGNSTQKDVMSLQGGATHPLPLSDQSGTTAFRTGMEILRRVINHTKFIQSAINYPSHVRSLSSLLLVKKNKSKTLSWMEPDLSFLQYLCFFPHSFSCPIQMGLP